MPKVLREFKVTVEYDPDEAGIGDAKDFEEDIVTRIFHNSGLAKVEVTEVKE